MESLISVMNVMAVLSNGDKACVKGTHMVKDDNYITVYLKDVIVGWFMNSDTIAIYMTQSKEGK